MVWTLLEFVIWCLGIIFSDIRAIYKWGFMFTDLYIEAFIMNRNQFDVYITYIIILVFAFDAIKKPIGYTQVAKISISWGLKHPLPVERKKVGVSCLCLDQPIHQVLPNLTPWWISIYVSCSVYILICVYVCIYVYMYICI